AGDAAEEPNPLGVPAREEVAGKNGGLDAVLGVDDEDGVAAVAGRAGGPVGHRLARGEPGRQVEGEERLADARVAVEDGHGAEREVRLPEPVDGERVLFGRGGGRRRGRGGRGHGADSGWRPDADRPAYFTSV